MAARKKTTRNKATRKKRVSMQQRRIQELERLEESLSDEIRSQRKLTEHVCKERDDFKQRMMKAHADLDTKSAEGAGETNDALRGELRSERELSERRRLVLESLLATMASVASIEADDFW